MSPNRRNKERFLDFQEEMDKWEQEAIYLQERDEELERELLSMKPDAIIQLTKTPEDEPEEHQILPF